MYCNQNIHCFQDKLLAIRDRPAQSLGGAQGKIEIWGALYKNYFDSVFDNHAFIAFFTGEPEDNYSNKVMCPALTQHVGAQCSMSKQSGLINQK